MKKHSLYKPKWRPLKLDGGKWRKLRKHKLALNPLCEACHAWGDIVPATDVDHIDNDATNNRMDNLMSLCHSCHSKKTAQEQRGTRVTIYGFGEDGYPLTAETMRQKIASS
ncbi:MAG: HNH endonuclease signature motif containing protein [Cardiobacteriaceae bacterium]|nr:HNH endonuclease signature motif containing protein [Cardiobacteriaceae bacterium]